jgi:large subunit ribosomal protein L31
VLALERQSSPSRSCIGAEAAREKFRIMKTGIHPDYKTTTITCGCGNSWQTRSTKQNLHVDVCSACHPFFTGEQRLVDTAGQVERFQRRLQQAKKR